MSGFYAFIFYLTYEDTSNFDNFAENIGNSSEQRLEKGRSEEKLIKF